MPIKKHRLSEQAPALRQFTNRESFLAAFDYTLDTFSRDRHGVLTYYGVGGIGKTSLIHKLIGRLRGDPRDERHARPIVAPARIDFQDSANWLPAKALERARARFHDDFKVSFPTFDIAFAIYWKLANPSLPLTKSELRFLQEGEIAGDVIALLADMPVVGLVAKLPRVIGKAGRAARLWWTEHGQKELTYLRGLDTAADVEVWLPAFFGADLKAWLAEEPHRRAVLFLDTHDMVEE